MLVTVSAAGVGEVATDAPDFDLAGGHWGVRVIGNGVTLVDSLHEVFSGSFSVQTPPGPQPGLGIFNTFVNFVYGQPFDVEVMIEVLATTNASDAQATVTHSRLDFSDTVRISSITLPPGAVLQTASGTLYPLAGASSSVPESDTVLLLAGGIGGLAGLTRLRCPPRPHKLAG